MITTDNNLHAEIILLATKALDLLSADVVGRSALPLGSSKNASERYSSAINQSTYCHARRRDPLPCSEATDQSADCHARRRDPLPAVNVTLGGVTHYQPTHTAAMLSASTISTSGRTATCAITL